MQNWLKQKLADNATFDESIASLLKKTIMKSTRQILSFLLLLLGSTTLFAQTVLAEKHFEADRINSVKVIGTFCDITVVQKDRLVFDGLIKGKGDQGDYVIAVIQSGDDVVFKVERKKDRNWGWNDIDIAKIDLEVPSGTELTIENSSGDIRISGFEAKELQVGATSGDVMMKEVNADVRLSTTSGDVTLRMINGNVSMRSTSGDQEYFDITGDLKTQATSGDIEIAKLNGDLDVTSTSGDMDFDDVSGRINATSTSGDIQGEYILLTQDSRFKSTSGNIYMELKNDLDEVGFDLRATSGDLEVGRLDGEDHLVIRRGDILVTGISTSGDQTYTN